MRIFGRQEESSNTDTDQQAPHSNAPISRGEGAGEIEWTTEERTTGTSHSAPLADDLIRRVILATKSWATANGMSNLPDAVIFEQALSILNSVNRNAPPLPVPAPKLDAE